MKRILALLLICAICLSLVGCNGDTQEPTGSAVTSETDAADSVLLFSPQLDQGVYDAMKAFLADSGNTGLEIRLRGEVDVKEDETGKKTYTANIEGSNETWIGPVFVIEGLAADQYPVYEDVIEIEGVYQPLDDYGYPGINGVVVPQENYRNLSVEGQESAFMVEETVTQVHTVLLSGLGISVTYMGVLENVARFLIQNYSDVDGSVRSSNNAFNGVPVEDGFWCAAAAQSVGEGGIELPDYEVTEISFELEIATDDDLEVRSERITIQL